MSFKKGLFIIIANFILGMLLIVPLYFHGVTKSLMYLVLLGFIAKELYGITKENQGIASKWVLLCLPVSGIISGFFIGIIIKLIAFNYFFLFLQLLLILLCSSILILNGGMFLAYRISQLNQQIQQ